MSQVLTAQTENGNGPVVSCGDGRSSIYLLKGIGTWDTASMIVQISLDEGTSWDSAMIPGGITAVTALTADGFILFYCPNGGQFRVNVSSVGASTDLNAWVGRVNE